MDPKRRIRENPFFVLGLPTDASRQEIERTAQRQLAELALGRASVKTYATPFGPAPRSEDLVRAAVAELRDPQRRLVQELWARAEVRADERPPAGAPAVDWSLAESVLGIRRPR
jgi:hypothetical protein